MAASAEPRLTASRRRRTRIGPRHGDPTVAAWPSLAGAASSTFRTNAESAGRSSRAETSVGSRPSYPAAGRRTDSGSSTSLLGSTATCCPTVGTSRCGGLPVTRFVVSARMTGRSATRHVARRSFDRVRDYSYESEGSGSSTQTARSKASGTEQGDSIVVSRRRVLVFVRPNASSTNVSDLIIMAPTAVVSGARGHARSRGDPASSPDGNWITLERGRAQSGVAMRRRARGNRHCPHQPDVTDCMWTRIRARRAGSARRRRRRAVAVRRGRRTEGRIGRARCAGRLVAISSLLDAGVDRSPAKAATT